jgi:thiamine-monophosphate kinase
VNEFELIARFFSRPPRAGSVHLAGGDDAALLAPAPGCELAVSVDMLVGGRHFLADTDPERLGHKTLAVNLSDMAAMGATPKWALLAGALPDADPAWLAAFARGFYALADAHAVDLVGGDTTRGPLNLCVTIMGEVPAGQALLRSGARPGDDVYVSGALGDAALALAARAGRVRLDAEALAVALARLEMPLPRIALGLALRGVATAAIDVSDGLVGDLAHILERSAAGATIELAAIPRSPALARLAGGEDRALALECLLAGGDDYELCFTAPRAAAGRIAAIAESTAVPLARIGVITEGPGLVVRDERGVPLSVLPRAFDHFA